MKVKALFLDRDGVINMERGDYTWKKEDISLLPDLIPFLHSAKKKGYTFFVITNQGGIGKGIYTTKEYLEVEQYIADLLAGENLFFEEVYYCPHHPTTGKCLCRKPGSLLLEKAIARFNIDAGISVMIGDRERDVVAANGAGVKGILIESNSPLLPILEQI